MAIRGETLAAIGTAAEILKMARPDTQIVDAKGQTLSLPDWASVGSRVHVAVTRDGVELRFTEEGS